MFITNNLIQENIMKNDWRITRFAKVLDAIEELESVICHALDIDLGDDMIKPLEVLKDNVKEAEVDAWHNGYIKCLEATRDYADAVIAANAKESA